MRQRRRRWGEEEGGQKAKREMRNIGKKENDGETMRDSKKG